MEPNFFPFLDPKESSIVAAEFGSVRHLYIAGLELASNEYAARSVSPSEETAVRNKIYELEDRLNKLGLDGHRITTHLRDEFGEWLVEKKVAQMFASLDIRFENSPSVPE
jgi:hypothetical protein